MNDWHQIGRTQAVEDLARCTELRDVTYGGLDQIELKADQAWDYRWEAEDGYDHLDRIEDETAEDKAEYVAGFVSEYAWRVQVALSILHTLPLQGGERHPRATGAVGDPKGTVTAA